MAGAGPGASLLSGGSDRFSAGILFYRRAARGIEVLLVLPGGPWWRNRDQGAWQIPKGAVEPGEDAQASAFREVMEELGVTVTGKPVPLATVRQSGGKRVQAFAIEQDIDPDTIASNDFTLEWPPASGATARFPEVARARWFPLASARPMMLASQRPLLDALVRLLDGRA
ncbi:MAG: NUDIX hydrolase [Sphingomonas sp.]|nr:NUDIX hydrolase [Sphingomonas sp.]|tara:strand:- start:1364 stop:1873 length:510 start_codon:yes stop_codon:yes gene_type:complete